VYFKVCVVISVLFVVLVSASANGEPLPPALSLDGPAGYTPSTAFTVDVRLTGAEDLAGYGFNLVLDSPTGTAGVDFSFANVVDMKTQSQWVFDSLPGAVFVFVPTADDTMFISALANPLFADTSPGHALLASVTILPADGFSGDINVSIPDDAFLELLGPSGTEPLPDIAGFDDVVATLPSMTVVPEPLSLFMIISGAACMFYRRKR